MRALLIYANALPASHGLILIQDLFVNPTQMMTNLDKHTDHKHLVLNITK